MFTQPIIVIYREDQNAALYRMLNIEHLAIYIIFTIVMIIALFNVIGALIMMILDKERQLRILFVMGFSPSIVRNTFFAL